MALPASPTPASRIALAATMKDAIGPLSLTTGFPIRASPSSQLLRYSGKPRKILSTSTEFRAVYSTARQLLTGKSKN